ncbi:hypothetical protein N7466_005226 [Penicillium verhagenii]|uniref:uncharacterized protein n=1 Tax=Penicillium verhagenii TaxID=1562060 RepID=UPI0025450A3D|nr:uncharacterized protein N7466_005226 [Penicillium verhagenii]KAJ5935679.1 hypothetical protein N7466_005226 [Penicillium verhagenii]
MSPRFGNRSPLPSHDRAPSRSSRSRSRDSRPRSVTRSPSPDAGRRDRRTRSPSRSRSPSRERSKGGRRYRSHSRSRTRSRSYSRSPSRDLSPPGAQRLIQIVVEKLTKNVTEAHLREIFGDFGDIENLDLPMNGAFMHNRGTAYILYYDPADAEAAIAHMHEAQLDGAVLNVSIILPRRNFSQSPPPAIRNGGRQPKFGKGSHAKSPPRRQGRARPGEMHDSYRPPSFSRSRSPRPRGSARPESPHQHRRRSPSYSNYSHSDRSRSPRRSRSRNRH